jgi:hypothetical protein
METLTKLPDLALSFKLLKLSLDIENKANMEAEKSILGYAIAKAYRDKVNYKQIINTLKSQSEDNFDTVSDIFGEDLTKRILEIDF